MSELGKFALKAVKYILGNYYTYLIIVLLTGTFFTVTPFIKNTMQTPFNKIYLGAENDYKTYFTYLKTTLTGQNLPLNEFEEKLPTLPPDEKYYFIKGRLDSILSLSHFSSYEFSRITYNFLFFVFLYLVISHIFTSRQMKLTVFSKLALLLFPLLNLFLLKQPLFDFNSYPHIALFRLTGVLLIFIFLKIIRLVFKIQLKTPLALKTPIAAILIFLFLIIGFVANRKLVNLLTIDLNSDKEMTNLIYLSKDFYAGIGYIRDNADPKQKVICLKRCSIVSDLFAGVESVLGPFDNLSPQREAKLKEDLPGIFDSRDTVMKEFENENAAYFFIGPEEKPYITPDFTRLQIKEVIKNKEVTVYKILPPQTGQ